MPFRQETRFTSIHNTIFSIH